MKNMKTGIQKFPQRGEETRDRLLEVGILLFGKLGFDGVSTRDIVRSAGITLPSIAHHFGSKEGLYEAVLEKIAEHMAANIAAAHTEAKSILGKRTASRKEKIKALEFLLYGHARAVLQNRPELVRLMIQEQTRPSKALTPITQVFEDQFMAPLVMLLADVLGMKPKSPEVRLQALFLVGRVLVFRVARHLSLNTMEWDDFTPVRIEKILEALRQDLHCILANSATKQRSLDRKLKPVRARTASTYKA